ncbi:MAG: SiaB family protein kinase [Alphaproteobacteria bacterium]|nr:SiaB family protein kinase [Alphaproteobacteria bacterium]
MLANELFGFGSQLRRSGIMFAYCGYVTESVLSGVGDALKQKLVIEDTDTKTVRSVFAVFVEQMQNIIRYSAEMGARPSSANSASSEQGAAAGAASELRFGIVTIGREADGFVVKAGNLVDKSDVERLRAKLEHIRGADRDTLKAMYKETLKTEPEAGSKGAGVGFIEIARRASKPIAFDFAEVDDQFAFFALEAKI